MIEHVPPPVPEPSWRKPVGMLMILAIITLWAIIVASASGVIGRLPGLLQGLIYVIAGIVWILPLKPLLAWMETGSWKWGGAAQKAEKSPVDKDSARQ